MKSLAIWKKHIDTCGINGGVFGQQQINNIVMTQYIDKSALVAELKKRFDYRVNGLKAINNGTFWKEGQSKDEFNAVLTRCAYNTVKS